MALGPNRLKVLILGGYGTFGSRLAELLSDEPRLTLLIAGRSKAKAQAFCETLPGNATTEAVGINRRRELEARFTELGPDIVVDASGPFQVYGEHPYRVVEAALADGAEYGDLADSADFVRGIGALDAAARQRGKFVLSGLSTCPVLTAAVARRLSHDLESVDSIAGGIAPSPHAGLGRNVVRAIATYAGRPISLRREGRTDTAYPFTETCYYTIAPPGAVPLPPIEFSLIDVPDLTLLTDLWPELRSVWFGVGPLPAVLHRLLRGLARAVRRGLIPTLAPLAPLMHLVITWLSWGEHRGGMFVEIEGRRANGTVVKRSWHLVAEGDEGPNIPAMPAEIIVRRVLAGRRPDPGARAAIRELELDDYERAFERKDIAHGQRTEVVSGGDEPLFKRILGETWDELPWSVREMHDAAASSMATGRAHVEGGDNGIARTLARLFRFPAAADDIGLRVAFERDGGAETWRRTFGKQRFESVLYEGEGRFEGLLCERYGPFTFGMALALERDRLCYVVRRWSVLGLPLPSVLAARVDAYEYELDGQFHLYVEIAAPWVGTIVSYEGYLK